MFILIGCSNKELGKVIEIIDSSEQVIDSSIEIKKNTEKLLTSNKDEEYFTVSKIYDGDTIGVITNQNELVKIRLLMIDTPEVYNVKTPEPYALEASAFTNKLLSGQKVKLEYDKEIIDPYGRTLAYVYLEDGRMVNEEILKHGLAKVVVYKPNNKYEQSFKDIESKAKSQHLGLWSIR